MNYNLFGEPIIKEDSKKVEKSDKERSPDKYESFGLDKNKSTYLTGKISLKFCAWCLTDYDAGFSMCFVNWIICKSCIDKGIDEFQNNAAFKRDSCMKCKSNDLVDAFTSAGEGFQVGICLDCLRTGQRALDKYESNLNYKTGQYRIL